MKARARVATVLAAAMLVVLVALPAAADPAGPTNYRSTVTAVDAADGEPVPVDVEVLGGDSFLALEAEPGVRVEIPGYDGEPYLRVHEDGTVEVNERSPARWINDARYGAAEVGIPPSADPDAPPDWVQVADGGAYAWHDHRIHFMSPSLPDSVDPAAGAVQPVFDWEVPLTVEDRPVTVTGDLAWVPGPSPLVPAALVAAALLAGGSLFAWSPASVAPVVLATAVAAGGIGAAGNLGLPAGAEGQPVLVGLPVFAVVLALAGLLQRRRAGGGWLLPAAGLPLVVWGLLQAGALTRPIVPGAVSAGGARAVIALALGVGAAAVVVGTWRLLAGSPSDVADAAAG